MSDWVSDRSLSPAKLLATLKDEETLLKAE
jgi:hypothetical protein